MRPAGAKQLIVVFACQRSHFADHLQGTYLTGVYPFAPTCFPVWVWQLFLQKMTGHQKFLAISLQPAALDVYPFLIILKAK